MSTQGSRLGLLIMHRGSAANNGGLSQAGALQDQRPTFVVGTLRVPTDLRNPHTESAGHK